MGYRSEVVLAVSKKMMPHFLGHLSQCDDAAYKFVFVETDKKIEDYDGEGTTVFSWEGIKWYDDYPEVRAITDFVSMSTDYLSSICEDVKEFQRGEYGEHFRFVRMGENNEDVEEEGWLCCDDIGIRRAVSF
tara:strand:- start:167 stop:562 length:396 start_codon:yes stop_codon:yes gene_type:complete